MSTVTLKIAVVLVPESAELLEQLLALRKPDPDAAAQRAAATLAQIERLIVQAVEAQAARNGALSRASIFAEAQRRGLISENNFPSPSAPAEAPLAPPPESPPSQTAIDPSNGAKSDGPNVGGAHPGLDATK